MGKGLLGNPRANYDINMLAAQHISLSCAFFCTTVPDCVPDCGGAFRRLWCSNFYSTVGFCGMLCNVTWCVGGEYS